MVTIIYFDYYYCSVPYAYFARTRMGYPICVYSYRMPIRVWDDIFIEFLSYYKCSNLAQNSSIEVQTY